VTLAAVDSESAIVTHCVAGLTAQEGGRLQEAIEHFRDAVALAPEMLDMRLLLAFAQGASNDRIGAHATLAGISNMQLLSESDARKLADAATSLGADRVARDVVERILTFAPLDADLHSTLGALHHRLGDTSEATTVLHRAQTRWPTHVPTLMNYARLLSDTGEHAEALAMYEAVLRLSPSHAAARWYCGLLQLLLGQFEEGWRNHEARRSLPFMQELTPAGIPEWRAESLSGKTVLLWGEQGLGDQIMGVRFAAVLAGRGARVVVRCHESLVSLVRSAEGVSLAIANNAALPACDFHVPMLSVPHLSGLSSDFGCSGNAYLKPRGEASSFVVDVAGRTRGARESSPRPRVGLVWAGSATHGNDHNRSFPAELLPSLLDDTNVDWLSLQLGPRRADLDRLAPALRARVTDASNAITDFNDTAHIVASCDMVVTVDTSVAHLAGALGISTIVMLPYVPDWRWQIARRDTPWYASTRLVRQPMAGSWEHVVAEVRRAVNSGSV
jgi:Flp pilus assembly protein TadD